MSADSRRLQNINGAARGYLKVVTKKDTASSKINDAVKASPANQKLLTQKTIESISRLLNDSDTYQLELNSRTTDNVLGRTATLLDEVFKKFNETELSDFKAKLLDAINNANSSSITTSVLKQLLVNEITALFDDHTTPAIDVDSLKQELADLVKPEPSKADQPSQVLLPTPDQPTGSQSQEQESPNSTEDPKALIQKNKKVKSLDDAVEGDYADSTVAENFQHLQDNITDQLNTLNDNVKGILGGIGIGKLFKSISRGFSIFGKVQRGFLKALNPLASLRKTLSTLNSGIKHIKIGISSVKKGVAKSIGVVGKIGKSVGSAIAHPFKSLGNFLTNRKAKKLEAKKEKMREKFMDFMMRMFEKIWDFVEPVLSKVKIFMLMSLVPILSTAATVLAIIAAITTIGLALVLVYMWVKNKLIPKIINIWKNFKASLAKAWTATKKMFASLWEGIKKFFIAIWDGIVYIVTFKWLVDLGNWLWKKLVQFGKWLYTKFIRPLIQPLLSIWKNKIWPKIKPFADSIMTLVNRIKSIWKKFQWNENKSFFENLKCLAKIVISAIRDWWNSPSNPIRKAYDKFIAPIIKSLQNLMARIREVWDSFKWDSSKSFLENIKALWTVMKTEIKDWWKTSDIKKYWNKLTDWLENTAKKVRDWWNGTSLGKWINSLEQKINDLKLKMAPVFFTVPGIFGLTEAKHIYPFGPAVGKPFSIDAKSDPEGARRKAAEQAHEVMEAANDEIAKLQNRLYEGDYGGWFGPSKDELELKLTGAKLRRDEALKQYNQLMKPVDGLRQSRNDVDVQLENVGKQMSDQVQEKEERQQKREQQTDTSLKDLMTAVNNNTAAVNKSIKDPLVVSTPIPVGGQRNIASIQV